MSNNQEVMQKLETMKTYKTFPHVINDTVEDCLKVGSVLDFVCKNLGALDPEVRDFNRIDAVIKIINDQVITLNERADLLISTAN